ncbi:MAG: hypothetical protein ABW321_00240, partial [Polyangiales bacterium]
MQATDGITPGRAMQPEREVGKRRALTKHVARVQISRGAHEVGQHDQGRQASEERAVLGRELGLDRARLTTKQRLQHRTALGR